MEIKVVLNLFAFDECDLYMQKVEEFHTLADQCIYLQNLMREGDVNPFDHM